MILSPEDIEEFRKIYKKEFRKNISKDEARLMAANLLELYILLYSDTKNPEE